MYGDAGFLSTTLHNTPSWYDFSMNMHDTYQVGFMHVRPHFIVAPNLQRHPPSHTKNMLSPWLSTANLPSLPLNSGRHDEILSVVICAGAAAVVWKASVSTPIRIFCGEEKADLFLHQQTQEEIRRLPWIHGGLWLR